MSLEGRVRERLGKKRKDPKYQAERLSLEVTEELAQLMAEQGVTKADLARRLGVSKARVTHLLNGTPNMTLKTIAAAAVALDAEVSFELRNQFSDDNWRFVSRTEMPVTNVRRLANSAHFDVTDFSSRKIGLSATIGTRSPRIETEAIREENVIEFPSVA